MVTPVTVVPVAGLRTRLVIEVGEGAPTAIVNAAEPYSVVGGIAEIAYEAGVTEEVTVDEYVTVALFIVAVRVVLETTAVKSTVSVPELNVQLLMVTPVTVVPVAGLRTRLVIEVGVPEIVVNAAEPYSVVAGIAEMVNVVGVPEVGVAAVRENVDE
jgi:hypothetical protein